MNSLMLLRIVFSKTNKFILNIEKYYVDFTNYHFLKFDLCFFTMKPVFREWDKYYRIYVYEARTKNSTFERLSEMIKEVIGVL